MAETATLPERVRMRKDHRRAAILDAAITIIGERGYQAFSINELARRCEITTAGLLHHFGSKEGLLIALLEERDRRNQSSVASSLELRRDQVLTRDQVLKTLHAIVRQDTGEPQLVRAYAMLRAEALGRNHPAQAYFRQRERGILALFAEILAPHAAEPEATAGQIQAAMYGLQLQWLRDDCAFDLVAAWDMIAEKLLH